MLLASGKESLPGTPLYACWDEGRTRKPDEPLLSIAVLSSPQIREEPNIRGCLKSSTGLLPVERLQSAGPGWPCETWAGCPCYDKPASQTPSETMALRRGVACRPSMVGGVRLNLVGGGVRALCHPERQRRIWAKHENKRWLPSVPRCFTPFSMTRLGWSATKRSRTPSEFHPKTD